VFFEPSDATSPRVFALPAEPQMTLTVLLQTDSKRLLDMSLVAVDVR
jgi:hypothetical protein